MPNAIPLNCGNNAGTGFLVTDGTSIWLTSCVHLVTGVAETSNDAAPFINAVMTVVGTGAGIPLFDRGKKRFTVIVNTTDGMLVDAIAIKLTPAETAVLVSFGMYKTEAIVAAQVGDTVTAQGFPGLKAAPMAAKRLEAEVEQIEGVSIKLSNPSARGASGSAVVNHKGLVGILHGDVGTGSTLSNGLVVSLDVIAGVLFR